MTHEKLDMFRKVLVYLQDRMKENTTKGGGVILVAAAFKFLPTDVATALVDILPTVIGILLILIPDSTTENPSTDPPNKEPPIL